MDKYINTISYNPLSVAVAVKEPKYFIIGRCTCGSRHYSESLFFSEMFEEIGKYEAVVDYFGGGIVEVYKEDGTIIYSKEIFDI